MKSVRTSSTRNKSKKVVEDAAVDTKKVVFLLTGSQEEYVINASIITSLGGSVCKSGRIYDPTCTHVICSELKRTEKFVAGCAAGKVSDFA